MMQPVVASGGPVKEQVLDSVPKRIKEIDFGILFVNPAQRTLKGRLLQHQYG
jgi:hypothetical protein